MEADPGGKPTNLTDLFGLTGTAAIVTGGGSGIGRACALLLARLGCAVCVVDRDADAAARTVALIQEADGRALSVPGDAREASTAAEAARATAERFGRIDVLVNNVGGMFPAPASEISAGGWSAVLRLNLDSTFQFAQAVAPAMLSAGRGAIVNVASVAGIAGSPGAAHYGAAKAGVINLTRTLALEWAPKIRVNCVAPDFIRTEGTERLMTATDRRRIARLIPLRRLGVPDDVAKVAVFLASDLASFVTGQTLVVDGGSLFRSRLDFAASAPSDHR